MKASIGKLLPKSTMKHSALLLALLGAVLSLVAGIGIASAEEAASPSHVPPAPPSLQETQPIAQSEGASLQTSPEAAEEMPHTDLDRGEAIDLMTAVFPTALEAPAGIFGDLEITSFHSDHVAVVPPDSPGENPGLLTSMLPLRTEDGDGTKQPVDLGLALEEGEIQPANPLVDVEIPRTLGEGISLPVPDIEIRLEDAPAASSPSTVAGAAAFYPNVATDSDLTVIPTPTGVETLTLLRSPEAPTDQTYQLQLPAGAHLEGTEDGGALARSDGEIILSVRPPTAIDAAGEAVPVSMQVSGNAITLHVEPQPQSVYPILVDPVYEAYYWMAWGGPAGMYTDWKPFTTNQTYFKPSWYGILGASQYAGLDLRSYPGPVTAGERASWNYYVPRYFADLENPAVAEAPSSYIRAMSFSYTYFQREETASPGYNHPYLLAGLWDAHTQRWVSALSRTGWEGDLNAATIELPNPSELVDVKYGGLMLATSETTSRSRHILAGQAAVEVSDHDLPNFTFAANPPKWFDTSVVEPINFELTDDGLGAFSMQAKVPLARGGSSTTSQAAGCSGAASSPCPRAWVSTVSFDPSLMAQGEDVMELTGKDPIGYSTLAPRLVKIKVDHTPPAVGLSGNLTEQGSVGTKLTQYTLNYNAGDGDSEAAAAGTPVGLPGAGAGQLQRPMGVAVDAGGNVLVVDRLNNRVEKFDPSGKFLSEFGVPGTGPGQLSDPREIAVSANGNIWVSEFGNRRVQQFSSAGQFIRQIQLSSFVQPYGLATGPSETLWVTDIGSHKIYRFREDGTFLGEIGKLPGINLTTPVGIDTDAFGNAWVAEQTGSKIIQFAPNGDYLFSFGAAGAGDGQLNGPSGIAVAPSGNLLVVDALNDRVQEFKPDGKFLRKFGSAGTGNAQLKEARGIAVGPGNLAYVADSGNQRVAKWTHADLDPQSGSAKVEVKVDGSLVKTQNPGCATQNCAIAGSWTLNADSYAVGAHKVDLIATDAVGRSTTRTLNVETHGDLAPPAIALSGAMTEQATLGTTRPAYRLKVSATDPGSAEERKSGVASTTIKVDGTTVDTTSPGCAAGGCAVTRERTLNSNSYAVGSHSVQVSATDAAGRVTTKTLAITINRDTTAPEIDSSNAFNTLINRPEGWVEQKSYGYWPFATDVNGYGVTSLAVKLDGAAIASTTQSCANGSCGANVFGSVNMASYDGGAHSAEIVATDGAGNTRKKAWTINVDPLGAISTSEATDTLEAVEETAPETTELAPVGGLVTPAEEESGGPSPALAYENGQIESEGAPAPSTIGLDPETGFTVETTSLSDTGSDSGDIQIVPLNVNPTASDPAIADEAAAVIANSDTQVDTVLRPAYDGIMSFKAIRDKTGPENYEWEVKLGEGEELKLIDSKHAGIFWDDGTQALLIYAHPAHGADGTEVPTSLAVAGNVIIQTVHHRAASYVYPVIAGVGWEGGFVEYPGVLYEPYAPETPEWAYVEGDVLIVGPPEVVPTSEASASSVGESRKKYLRVRCAEYASYGLGVSRPVAGECGNPFTGDDGEGVLWQAGIRGAFFFTPGTEVRHKGAIDCEKAIYPSRSIDKEWVLNDDYECRYGPKTADGNGGVSAGASHYLRAQAHWLLGYRGWCGDHCSGTANPWYWIDRALELRLWPSGSIEKLEVNVEG